MTVGLISASITAFYNRDSSYLPSLPDLPSIPRLPNARSLVSGRTVFFGIICLVVILILGKELFNNDLYFFSYLYCHAPDGILRFSPDYPLWQ
jgi:hypothetical protein